MNDMKHKKNLLSIVYHHRIYPAKKFIELVHHWQDEIILDDIVKEKKKVSD
jgi:hypothetical protein